MDLGEDAKVMTSRPMEYVAVFIGDHVVLKRTCEFSAPDFIEGVKIASSEEVLCLRESELVTLFSNPEAAEPSERAKRAANLIMIQREDEKIRWFRREVEYVWAKYGIPRDDLRAARRMSAVGDRLVGSATDGPLFTEVELANFDGATVKQLSEAAATYLLGFGGCEDPEEDECPHLWPFEPATWEPSRCYEKARALTAVILALDPSGSTL